MEGFLIAARAVHYSSTISLAGVFAFLCFVAGSQPWPRLRRRLLLLAGTSLVLAAALRRGLAVVRVRANERSADCRHVRQGVVATVLHRTRFGQIWTLRLLLAVANGGAAGSAIRLAARVMALGRACYFRLRPRLARLGRARRRNPRAARRSPFDGGYTPPPCGGRLGWITRSARPAAERAAPRPNRRCQLDANGPAGGD